MNDVQNTLLVIHILLAVVLLGPLIVNVLLLPGVIRSGQEGLATLKWIHKLSAVLGKATVLILLLGVALVVHSDKHAANPDHYTFRQAWVTVSIALFVVALINGAVFIKNTTSKAITTIEAGGDARDSANLVTVLGAANTAIVLIILVLMVWKPGT